MADNNSSSSVASVAIVILVILVGVGIWYFVKNGGVKETTETTKVEVSLPSTDAAPAKSN